MQRWFGSPIRFVLTVICLMIPSGFQPDLLSAQTPGGGRAERRITVDFNNVDLPIFVKFISELTGKSFVIDERVKGKVTIFAPTQMTVETAYEVFLSVMELKGFSVVGGGPEGEIYQIRPSAEIAPERNVYVYTLENTNAEDMAKVILGLVSRPQTPTRRGARPVGEISGAVQVLAEKNTNALVLTASEEDFEVLKRVIQQLDTKRRQVFVEAVILEVSLDRLRDLGTDVAAAFGYQTPDDNLTVLGGINASPGEFADIGRVIPNATLAPVNVRTLLRFLQSSTDANVLSTPTLLTSDNQKAEITVGQNVPFPLSQSQTVGGNVQTSIERRDVGVILRLTPQVLENDLVKMDVYQEISSLLETPQVVGNVVLGPTTNKRTANTTVVARSGQTIVIGGLIRDNLIKTERKVPLLGDIPLLGYLFKFQSRRSEKTNLLIFLTPHLIREEGELDGVKSDRVDRMNRFLIEKGDELALSRQNLLRGMVNFPD